MNSLGGLFPSIGFLGGGRLDCLRRWGFRKSFVVDLGFQVVLSRLQMSDSGGKLFPHIAAGEKNGCRSVLPLHFCERGAVGN